MFVRKFEADSLEEALGSIKKELGPDAIILKTVTNKGIKGAFKSKKIEITAAISEKSYVKKTTVDNVLSDDQKESFYKNKPSLISKMIDEHSPKRGSSIGADRPGNKIPVAYGNLGLNKRVNTTKSNMNISLDEFLDTEEENKNESQNFIIEDIKKNNLENKLQEENQSRFEISSHNYSKIDKKVIEQEEKIKDLENSLKLVKKNIENLQFDNHKYLSQLAINLRSLDVSPFFINKIIKKLLFELSEDELENEDVVFDFCLKEMTHNVEIKMPLFSKLDNQLDPCITILMSETSCGQSSMVKKICSLKKDAVLIEFTQDKIDNTSNFSEKLFVIEKHFSNNISEIVSLTKKSIEKNKSVFIDFRISENNEIDVKSFVESFKRIFKHVEILMTLSAIHSESYNKRIVNKYKFLVDGMSISMMDLCLNFGAIFNLCELKIPFVFFGTGRIIPDDLESSTSERILSGIFQIK